MKTLIILLLLLSLTHGDTIKDIEKRLELYFLFIEQTEDPQVKRFWRDRADLEKATLLFWKKYYKNESK